MAKTFTPPFGQTSNMPDGVILPADTTSKKLIWTAGANDGYIDSLFSSSSDTSDRGVILYDNKGGGGTDRQVCSINIPANSGNTTAILPLDLLHSPALASYLTYDAYGNRIWRMDAGTTLKVACTGTVTTAKEIDFTGSGVNY